MLIRSFSLFPVDFVGKDVVKIVSSDKTVVIEVGLVEDMIDLFFSDVLS